MKAELLSSLDALRPRLPPNALDALIQAMGGSGRVAEMTGRKGRLVEMPLDETGKKRVVYEGRAEDDVPLDMLNIRGESVVS